MDSKFEIEVRGATPAESQKLAQELADSLRLSDSAAKIDRSKVSKVTMDLGATIAVVVGSTAAAAIGNGVRLWLAKRQSAEINISRDGDLKASGITSADAVRLAEIFSK